MYLELDRLSKQFDGKYAVHDLSLGLEEGGLLCILGSSGCGKTTTLNMISGFLKPNGGRVLLDRQDITALPPERRPVSTVFQSYGLFPHMSVLQNVTYGLKFRGYSRAEAKEKGDGEGKTLIRAGLFCIFISEILILISEINDCRKARTKEE